METLAQTLWWIQKRLDELEVGIKRQYWYRKNRNTFYNHKHVFGLMQEYNATLRIQNSLLHGNLSLDGHKF